MPIRLSRGRPVRALIAVLVVFAAFFAATALASTSTVKVKDSFYSVKTLNISKGTTVNWKWAGTLFHDVKVQSGPASFHSRRQISGSYSHRFTVRGTYKLYCTLHPGMTMTVHVH